jgi:uncharacterized ion transporter superfamily protein YfcC
LKKRTTVLLEKIPHPVAILFGILVFAGLLTYIIPGGEFGRELVDGKYRVIPGSFKYVQGIKPGILNIFTAIPKGYAVAAEIIFAVLAGGIMFGLIEKTNTIQLSINAFISWVGEDRKNIVIISSTLVYGFLGIAVGYENNIAMVPIAVAISYAIGGDLILASGISVAAITIGFGLSPINPFTVGTGHKIAEMPMFSGIILRSILCLTGLGLLCLYNLRYFKKISTKQINKYIDQEWKLTAVEEKGVENLNKFNRKHRVILITFLIGLSIMLYGIFIYGWYINEISAIFLMVGIMAGIFGGLGTNEIGETVLTSVGKASPGAFMVGYAASIKQIMLEGKITDTICNSLVELLQGLPTSLSVVMMSAAQCIINFFIPSGSGQALTTLPIMIPLGDIVGITRQSTILAFQIGDGITNLVNPTLGGLIAMIAFCRVPFDKWIKFIFPLTIILVIVCWIFLLLAVQINWN